MRASDDLGDECELIRESPTATAGCACTLVERRKIEAEQMLSEPRF
jgi:hypothetical protein